MTKQTPQDDGMDDGSSPNAMLGIGEVSARTGVAVSALRFYEELGLISSQRGVRNRRFYPRHVLRRIALISVAKHIGIPLGEVGDLLADVPQDRVPSHQDWQRASREWKLRLEERRRTIEHLERQLTGCIGCGCLSMKACGLLNPNDALGQGGAAGPRRL